MKTGIYKYVFVLLSTTLFFTFSVMHEFDWVIPSSPAALSGIASTPMPDIVEEPGIEDEIEYEESYYILNSANIKFTKRLGSEVELYVAQVLSPPPDKV